MSAWPLPVEVDDNDNDNDEGEGEADYYGCINDLTYLHSSLAGDHGDDGADEYDDDLTQVDPALAGVAACGSTSECLWVRSVTMRNTCDMLIFIGKLSHQEN